MISFQQLAARLTPPLLRPKKGAIGIDLSLNRLHMVQFARKSAGNVGLHAKISLDYPDSRESLLSNVRELKRLVERGLSEGGFDGRKVVLGMPSDAFRTLSVNYRPQANVSDDQVLLKLMEERLDGAIDDYVIDYIPVRAEARDAEKLAIVAVSPRQRVTQFLNVMRAAGLTVDALEIGPVAIRRLTTALPSSTNGMILIINTGISRSYLTMLSGRRLLMDRPIDFSQERLLEALSRTLDIPEQSAMSMVERAGLQPASKGIPRDHREGETGIYNTLLEILKPEFHKLVEETDRAFMYAAAQARGGGDAVIYLLGSLARWDGADRILSSMTKLPVTTMPNPLRAFGDSECSNEYGHASAEPEFAVASGLALRDLVDDE